jgi:hypothetical protein
MVVVLQGCPTHNNITDGGRHNYIVVSWCGVHNATEFSPYVKLFYRPIVPSTFPQLLFIILRCSSHSFTRAA